MIDVVYLAFNRLEFTKASYANLKANTDWTKARLVVFDDGSTDGTYEWLKQQGPVRRTSLGSPVAVMNRYLASNPSRPYWAKIDSDTMVPPGWLDECVAAMEATRGLELLGIEAMNPVGAGPRKVERSAFIGGIGLFRTDAWAGRPQMQHDGRFGFTSWQDKNFLRTGWLNPSLPVFLLDRCPLEPWLTLSKRYVTSGWQRRWEPYEDAQSAMWDWWTK
jgi:glycosyltransferase involved in cell wall biosynthesis